MRAWVTKEICMNEKSTWRPTRQQVGNLSRSTWFTSSPSKRCGFDQKKKNSGDHDNWFKLPLINSYNILPRWDSEFKSPCNILWSLNMIHFYFNTKLGTHQLQHWVLSSTNYTTFGWFSTVLRISSSSLIPCLKKPQAISLFYSLYINLTFTTCRYQLTNNRNTSLLRHSQWLSMMHYNKSPKG